MLPLEIREYCYYLSQCNQKKTCLEELLCSVEPADPTKYDECYLLNQGCHSWVRYSTSYSRLRGPEINWGMTFPMYQLCVATSSQISMHTSMNHHQVLLLNLLSTEICS